METGDSSSFLRQDDRHANEEASEALLLGELSERGMRDRSKDEDPINSGLKMEVGLTMQPGAMTVPATGGTAVEGIPCKECGIAFESLQEYMEHRCPNARRLLPQGGIGSEVSDQEDSDAETLDGEILYQPNGSAFIIKESRESVQNSLPGTHGHFFTSDLLNHQTSVSPFPQVINTFHIASSFRKQLAAEPTSPNTSLLAGIGPVLHSFRVYDLRHKGDQNCRTDDSSSRNSCVSKDAHIGLDLSKFDGLVKDGKSKPVLMCFLCRMSFGYVRSFVNHAILDHKMVLNQEEQKVLSNKYVSAIIQGIGPDREPLISFLEPKKPLSTAPPFSSSEPICPDSSLLALWNALQAASTASLHASIPSVKGSMGFASPEDDSVTPNAETDLQSLSPSDTLLRQGCLLSGAESKIPESERSGNMEGSGPMDFSRMEYPIKREPVELAETEDDGGIYYCETEEDVNNCIGERADFSAGEDLTLSNQSTCLMKSSSFKPLVDSTLHFSAVTTQQALAPKDQNSDTDGQSGNETECMTIQNDASDSSLDEQSSSDRSPFPPHHQASGKPNTILDDASTGQGSASNDMMYAKCDTAQGSSLSLSDHLGVPQSGIPCKTLKCPMCNWHYKYQQSLDAHMKDKHPEMGSSCSYCGTGQPHPRLSRGENHTCGYKPFHCEVCNYSTTTKGNLTIHMQSDRHLTKIQALQNGGMEVPDGCSTHSSPVSGISTRISSPTKSKQRSSWRCEVCDYETSVAHNLRIHMTSEKHVHNIMLLQQTLKHMRGRLQPGLVPAEAQLYQYYLAQNMSLPGLKLESPSDLAHMMVSPFQFSPFSSPGVIPGVVNDDLGKDVLLTNSQTKGDDRPLLCAGELSPLVGDQPQKLFQCSLCNKFASDSLEVLGLHVSEERMLPLEDWRTIAGDHFQCRLCGYSTQLRANFLLHCQTDRHLQRYQLAAHLKEAGEPNYWRLKDVAVSNPVHLKCNVCDYRTNSVEKLRQHTANQRHEAAVRLYQHLQKQESMLNSESCYFYCALCDYSTKVKLHLVQHLLSAKHQQALGSQKLEFLHRGLGSEADALGDLFYVKDRPKKESEGLDGKIKAPAKTATNDQTKKDIDVHRKTKPGIATLSKEPPGTPVLGKRTLLPENGNDTTPKRPKSAEEAASNEQENQCSQCSYSTPDPNRMAMHMLSQHSMRSALCCPLCDDILSSRIHLQLHLTHLHSVAADCVEKLIAGVCVTETNVLMPKNSAEKLPEQVKDKKLRHTGPSVVTQKELVISQGGGPGAYRSKAQNKSIAGFQNMLELKPQKASVDAPSWKRNQDQKNRTWQWKDQSGLQNQQLFTSNHDGYKQGSEQCSTDMQELRAHSQHRTTTICVLCLCNFQTVPEFRKHLESVHPELSASDVERLCRTLPVSQMNTENGERMFESKPQKDLVRERKDSPARSDSGSPLDEVNTEQKHSFPLKKGSNFFVEKFLDPARPYKCTVCKESFTQKNILLVHYNSVSHLHKLKKVMHETTSPVLPEGSSKFDNKPFKCSICNVAYSQSSTLEIHMRSVLHQTKSRTSKVETGSSISNGNHGTTLPQRPVTINQEAIDSASLPASTPKDNQTKAKESNRKQSAENSSAVLTQQLSLTPGQLQLQRDLTQQAAFFQSPFLSPAFWPPFPMPPSVLLHFQQPQFLFPFYVPGAEIKLNPDLASQAPILGLPGMTQTLLEDLRLQQSQLQQLQQEATKKLACDLEVTPQKQEVQSCEPQMEKKDTTASEVHTTACEVEIPVDAAEESKKPDCEEESTKLNHISVATDDNKDVKKQGPEPLSLPPRVILGARGNAARALLENFGFELVIQYIENRQRNQRKNECADKEAIADKLECGTCGKLFSNILILKNHQEHVHRQIFPNGDLEKFAQQYREAYDKQYPMNPLCSATPPSTPPLPPPPLSPKPLPETGLTVGKSQTPTEQKAPESPTPTQATPPPPHMSPQIPVPTSVEPPPLLSVMTQQAGLSPYLSPQLPSSDSMPNSGIIQPSSQPKPDPASLEHVETKRPRARITKEQLKILCDSFKMNNYPGDEKVQELAEKSGLCQKFVKHWFRNTLLKERQRCKDSPYVRIPSVSTLEDEKLESQFHRIDLSKSATTKNKSSRSHVSDDQMRILQECFDANSNPKDYEIDHLSSILNMSSHKILVWFDHARQKARKIHESQMNAAGDGEIKANANESFSVQSCEAENGDCKDKECGDVSNQNVPNDLEQACSPKLATGRVALSDSPSVPSPQADVPMPKLKPENLKQAEDSSSQMVNNIPELQAAQVLTPQPARQKTPQELMNRFQPPAIKSNHLPLASSLSNSLLPQMLHYRCDQCKIIFPSAELWQEHQRMHLLATQNQFLHSQFLERSLEMPYMLVDPSNPLFTSQLLSETFSQMPVLNSLAHSSSPSAYSAALKRKLDDREENGSSDKDSGSTFEDSQRDKRPRTTISPEQLEILYEKYLLDSNPTRKMLEHIANTVGLKKRVVQVWFQNTRARERKGQFRALNTAQSHKKCPFCGSLFKALSALESHIRSRHWHEAKEVGFGICSSSMILSNDGEEIQNNQSDLENQSTKVETIESELPEYEMTLASASLAEEHLKYFANSSCSKTENEELEGTSVHLGEVSCNLNKADLDETSSVTTGTSDASTSQRGQSEQGEDRANPFQNYDVHREVQNLSANSSIQGNKHRYSLHGDDLDDSTDQSETFSVVDLSLPHNFAYRSSLEHGRLSVDKPGHRRSRTQMSNQQVMVLKACYSDCRTPTMHECETLGDKIGLAKRVVQVWFQNARAKEKKFKITVGKPFVVTQDSPNGLLPECTLCGTKFTTTFPIREHIFSKLHVEKLQERLRGHVDREKDHLTATTVRQLMAQQEFERFKKRTVDSLGTVAQQQSMTDGSALLSLSWPSSYPRIPGLTSGVNGHLKLPSFPPNTPGPPGDAFPSPVTPTTPISLSCTPTKTPHTPPPVPSSPLANHQVKLQDMDKPKTSVEPKLPLKEREISGCHLPLKKSKDREHEKRTPTKRTKSQGLLSTVAGDPGAFMAGQFLPYFVPGFVPCLPPQLPGFAQGGSIPPLCGLENLFPYGPGLPQAIAGLSSASLVQQHCKQYQQSVPDSLQQEKPQERKQPAPVPVEPLTTRSNTVQLKEEDAASFSAESTDQDLQSSTGNDDCPDAVMDPSMGEITCEKCRAVFTDQESALHHKESSSCFGQSFTDLQVAVAGKAASRKYNSMAQNPTISMDKTVNQHVGMSPHKDETARQAMRDAKEHIRLLPRSACSSTTPTSQSAISNRPISCTSMASWPSVLFQTSSLSTASFLSPSAPHPSPLSTAPLVTSTTRGTSESRHSLPTEICLDKLGGHLSQKLDSIGKSLDLKTKAAPGLNTNFRNIRMDMFTV